MYGGTHLFRHRSFQEVEGYDDSQSDDGQQYGSYR